MHSMDSLIDAVKILEKARKDCANEPLAIFAFIANAHDHINKQLNKAMRG